MYQCDLNYGFVFVLFLFILSDMSGIVSWILVFFFFFGKPKTDFILVFIGHYPHKHTHTHTRRNVTLSSDNCL